MMASPERQVPFLTEAWYAALESTAVRRNPVSVTRLGRRLVLWRDAAGRAVAQDARCPHRGADLGLGRVVDGCLECPFHGFRYDSGGQCVQAPCDGSQHRTRSDLVVKSLPVREENGFLWVWFGEPREDLPPTPWFSELPSVRPDVRSFIWDVSFPRVVEANLDLHHISFLHRRYSFGIGPLLDPYEAKLEGDVIRTHGVLRKDTGAPYKVGAGVPFELSVHFPGLMLARFGKNVMATMALTPVDEDHTWIGWVHAISIPVIGWLLKWPALKLEQWLTQPDDRRMLLSSPSSGWDLGASDKLTRADAGIGLWRKLYRERLRQAPVVRPETRAATL